MVPTPPSSVCYFQDDLITGYFIYLHYLKRPGSETQTCCLNSVWEPGFFLPSGTWPAGHAWTWVRGIRLTIDPHPLSWIIYICRHVFIVLFQSVLSLQDIACLAFLSPSSPEATLLILNFLVMSKLLKKCYFPHLSTEALSWLCSLIINSFVKLRSNLSLVFLSLEFSLACNLYNLVVHIV